MNRRHARYPFLQSARQAVQEAGVDLATIVAEDDAVVERALERVTKAVTEREVGEPARDPRTELLSYPVARVLVSLVDENILVRRYAEAEATTAAERFTADSDDDEQFASVGNADAVTREDLLREFDLADHVRSAGDGFRVDVATYLLLASSVRGEEWRLVNRPLADGEVPVDGYELDTLVQQAIEERIAEGLPLNVPDAIASELGEEVGEVKTVLSELDLTTDIDTVVPDLFPPCMKNLLERVRRGDHLPHHSRFAITAFLANIGLSTDEIVDIYEVNPGFGEEMTRYQTDHIQGESSPTEYTAPACATMKSYGDCVNPDSLCENISHPLSYYEVKLEDADEEELEDWREEGDSERSEESPEASGE
ncbi:DNA primase regulatory subunit PriL [Halospeciosus flavus]|uniref:DNA primase large subunit PriL n=1 Tax=Halospeciosus flavus TaxID=3032283 RepID=A0ABD5Z7J8_9EURY|nr:DNA primase regulatory subunit PriL [Halospeciosus flavus]